MAKSKKTKKITRKKLASMARTAKRKALADWSISVRNRDGNKCTICGRTEFIDAHHLIPKERFKEYMFEIMNGISLCKKHHKFADYSFHRHPFWSVIWLKNNRPDQFNWVVDRIPLDEPNISSSSSG